MDRPEKYRGLPYLATDEKDVYECGPDHPPTNNFVLPPPDACIEIIPTATVETFQRFQNSFMQSGFSEFDSKPVQESAVHKYNRIREEIVELKTMIDDLDQGDEVSINIGELEDNLSSLKLLTIGKVCMGKSASKPDETNGPVRNEILEAGKVKTLEQRIRKLENFLGTEKAQNFLNSNLKEESLMNLVVQLSNKATVLDHSSLDKIDARLYVVLDKLEQIAQKKDDLESLTKLNELYEYYVKTVDHNKRLPAILERLQVLSEIQRQASNFSGIISDFDNVQKTIQDSLDTTRNNLKALKESLENKSQSIEMILEDYNVRIEKLK